MRDQVEVVAQEVLGRNCEVGRIGMDYSSAEIIEVIERALERSDPAAVRKERDEELRRRIEGLLSANLTAPIALRTFDLAVEACRLQEAD